MDSLKLFFIDLPDAWLGLRRRPLRFLLSGLGIGIGVSALVAMLSIGEGAKQTALRKIASLGINTIRIERSALSRSNTSNSQLNLSQGLNRKDAQSIRHQISSDGYVAEYLKKDNIQISTSRLATGSLIAVTPYWQQAENIKLVKGRPLLHADIQNRNRVCIIAETLALKLGVKIGGTLTVGRFLYRVIGISAPKGKLLTEGTGLSAIDFDNMLIVPISTYPFPKIGRDHQFLDGMVIALDSTNDALIQARSVQINNLLQQRHRGVKDFILIVPRRLMQEAKNTQRIFSLVMGAIASLSLLVGGIGVMNVMLANITEQTRDIGLRMAIGASKKRIISLYLYQAVTLTTVSGFWGLFGGLAIAQIVQAYADWEVGYSIPSLVIGPLFAVAAGIVFGAHPALRAASISPAIALRDA